VTAPLRVGVFDLTYPFELFQFSDISVNGSPAGVALLPGSNQAWIAMDSPDAVVVFAPYAHGGILTVVNSGIQPSGVTPTAIAFTADGTLAFVTNSRSDNVSRIDTSTQQVLQFIPTDSLPIGIAIQDSLTFQPGGPLFSLNGVTGGFALTDVNIPLVGSVKWNFGNGAGFTTTALNTSYAYPSPGTYTARATVLDKSGGTLLTKTIPVQVQSPIQATRTAAVLTQRLLLPSSQQTSLQNHLSATYNALLAGNRSAALNDITLYVDQLNSLTIRPPGYAAALNEGKAIGTSLNQSCALCLGTGTLAPIGGSSAVDQPVIFTTTWTVPDGKSWRSLQHVDLRLVANSANGDSDATPLPIALWARFTVGNASGSTPSTFELLDQNENVVGVGEPGSPGVIETNTAKLYLADSDFQGSGPTGPSVTVNFAVSFKAAALNGNAALPYQSQLLASDALQGVQDPVQLGHWTVRPAQRD